MDRSINGGHGRGLYILVPMKPICWGEITNWVVTLSVFVLIIVWLLAGCSAQKKEVISVEYTKGCHISVKAADVESAGKVVENVEFKDCSVTSNEEIEK